MAYKIGMPTLLELTSLDATVEFCKRSGLGLIELNMTRPEFLPSSLPSGQLMRVAERDRIEFTLHLAEEVDLASFHDDVREAWIRNTVDTLKWAKDGGIVLATMHMAGGVHYTLPNSRVWLHAEYMDTYLTRMRDALGRVHSEMPADLCLCVENCGDFALPFIRRVLDENELSITWDIGHDAASGFSDTPYIREHVDRVRHMHLHDVRDGRSHQSLCTGSVAIDEALGFARERQIRVIIEVKTVESLRESIGQLRERGSLQDPAEG